MHWVCPIQFTAFPFLDSRDLPGIVPWNDPTFSDIKAANTAISQQLLPDLTSFALDPYVAFTTYIFQLDDRTLVVGVNLDPQERNIPLTQLPVWEGGREFEGGV